MGQKKQVSRDKTGSLISVSKPSVMWCDKQLMNEWNALPKAAVLSNEYRMHSY